MPTERVDAVVAGDELGLALAEELERLAPFGIANPSVSLKVRLRRAAFFDKRERDVAAGTAEPVEPDAGLPETMVEEQERELA